METQENTEVPEPQTPGAFSDADFDDNLDVPESLTVVDIQGSQVVLNGLENAGKQIKSFIQKQSTPIPICCRSHSRTNTFQRSLQTSCQV